MRDLVGLNNFDIAWYLGDRKVFQNLGKEDMPVESVPVCMMVRFLKNNLWVMQEPVNLVLKYRPSDVMILGESKYSIPIDRNALATLFGRNGRQWRLGCKTQTNPKRASTLNLVAVQCEWPS